MKTSLKRVALAGCASAIAAGAITASAGSASAATFSSAAPAKAASASVSSNIAVHSNVVGFPCGEGYTVIGTYVNVRASYGTSARIIAVAQRGDELIATFKTSYTYNGYYWAYGQVFTPDGSLLATGYMATAYLHDDGSAGCTVLS